MLHVTISCTDDESAAYLQGYKRVPIFFTSLAIDCRKNHGLILYLGLPKPTHSSFVPWKERLMTDPYT